MSGLPARALTGAVLIAVILLLRALCAKALPKRTFRVLWSITLLHLLLPKLPYSPLSLYNLGEWLMGRLYEGLVIPDAAGKVVGVAVSPVPPVEKLTVLPAHGLELLPLFWLLGALVCAGVFLLAYRRSLHRFRHADPVVHPEGLRWASAHPRIALRQSDAVVSPLSYGLLRPTILLPADFNWQAGETAACVLLHEELHLRRGDLWLKAGLALAACIYWFSPLSWIMLSAANRDIELACDEAVLARMGLDMRRAYAMALIRMETEKAHRPLPVSGFAGNALEARITAIMKTKKYTRTAIVAAVMLCLCITIGLAATGEPPAGEETTLEQNKASEHTSGEKQADIDAQLQAVIKPELAPEAEPETEKVEVWYWPVPVSNNITGRFGARIHPITGEKMIYDHITITADKDILAAQSGKVIDVFFDSYSGNTIVLEHEGYVTMYGHLAEVSVKIGDTVEGGMPIGTAGKTGQATGNCLAFWVSQNGTTVDPLQFYDIEPKFTTGEEFKTNSVEEMLADEK